MCTYDDDKRMYCAIISKKIIFLFLNISIKYFKNSLIDEN